MRREISLFVFLPS